MKTLSPYLLVFSIVFLAIVTGSFAAAQWSNPSSGAPNGNPGIPVNLGPISQTKSGNLTINSTSVPSFRATGTPATFDGVFTTSGIATQSLVALSGVSVYQTAQFNGSLTVGSLAGQNGSAPLKNVCANQQGVLVPCTNCGFNYTVQYPSLGIPTPSGGMVFTNYQVTGTRCDGTSWQQTLTPQATITTPCLSSINTTFVVASTPTCQ